MSERINLLKRIYNTHTRPRAPKKFAILLKTKPIEINYYNFQPVLFIHKFKNKALTVCGV